MKASVYIILSLLPLCSLNSQWVLKFQTATQQEKVEAASACDDNNFWFITNFDIVYKTSNGGASWNIISNPVFIPSGLFLVNKDTAFKTAMRNIYRTTNGGISWANVFTGVSNEVPCIWMKNNSEGVVSHNGQLFKTTNGGSAWSTSLITQPPAATNSNAPKRTVYCSGNNLWVSLNTRKVAYSSDYGVSWSLPSNSGLPFGSIVSIFFGSPSFGLIVMVNDPTIYVTTDGANSWRYADNSSGANEDVAINNTHCWYIPNPFDHFYIKYSQDSGTTWVQQVSGEGFSVLEKSHSGNTLWAGTITGKIYKYIDIVGVQNLQTGIPDKYSLSQNYPNPFNPNTIIKFDVKYPGFVTLKVYDIVGKEIAVLVNENLHAGSYQTNFNSGNLSSGVYFYTLKTYSF